MHDMPLDNEARPLDSEAALKVANDMRAQAEELAAKVRAMGRKDRRRFMRKMTHGGATKKGPSKARAAR